MVPLMRSMYGRALCHVFEMPLIEFLMRELRRGPGEVPYSGCVDPAVDLDVVLVLFPRFCFVVGMTYNFWSMVSGGEEDMAGSGVTDREGSGVGGCGCGSSGVTVLKCRFTFFCFGCLDFFVFVVVFSSGTSALWFEVTLALRFSLFFRCGVGICIVMVYKCSMAARPNSTSMSSVPAGCSFGA